MSDHSQTKQKIIQFLQSRGPSLPVHIAKEINQSILFTSAFLSELLSEKQIKTSHLRVGSSPIYFIPGQESQLEKYSDNIKGKEKEALLLLKEKKFLNDEIQQPAIRVALRQIKDFAIPFEKDGKLIWRYFTVKENEFEKEEIKNTAPTKSAPEEIVQLTTSSVEKSAGRDFGATNREPRASQISDKETPLNIFDKSEAEPKQKPTPKKPKKKTAKKTANKKTSSKTNEKFFNKVKEFLKSKQIEITEIEGLGKNELAFRVNKQGKEQLLFAHNKKQLKETDLIKANKKATEANLKYTVLCLGEPLKRVANLIDAVRNLEGIEKLY